MYSGCIVEVQLTHTLRDFVTCEVPDYGQTVVVLVIEVKVIEHPTREVQNSREIHWELDHLLKIGVQKEE